MPQATQTRAKAAPESKALTICDFKSLDKTEGTFSGYLSVFSVLDQVGDVVMPGAFKKTLGELETKRQNTDKPYLVPILFNHDQDSPIGGVKVAREDTKGLYIEGQLDMNVQRAREVHSGLAAGYIPALSIGYQTIKQRWNKTNRELLEIKLVEASCVVFPACEEAIVPSESVKSMEHINIEIDGHHVNLDVHGDASTTPTEEPAMPTETPETPNTLSRKAIDFTAAYSAAQNDLQEQWHDALQALVTSLYSIMSDDETPDKPAAVKASVNQFADTLDDLATRSAAAKFAPQLDYDGDSFTDTFGNTSDEDIGDMPIPYMGMMSAGGPDEVKKGMVMSTPNHKKMGAALLQVKAGTKALSDLHKKMAPKNQQGDADDSTTTDDTNAGTKSAEPARAGADASAQATTHTDDTDADIQSFRDYLQKEREALRRHA